MEKHEIIVYKGYFEHFPMSTSAQDLGTLSSWNWECPLSNAGSELLV